MQDQAAADYGQSWYAATAVAAPERPPLAVDLDVDACVIGGGLAGLTAALELARLGWSVVLLEEKRIAWNASGRNCGFVLPGYASDIGRVVQRVGLDQARRLWALSEAGLEYVRAAIREPEMPDVQARRGWLEVSKVDNGDELIALVGMLGQDFGADVEGWPTERVREVLRSDRYFHAVHFPHAFHLHPLNYALGLARVAEAAGVRIFESSPAIEIDPAGVRKRVLTPAAMVRAAHVVLAGNTRIGGLMPRLADTLLPVTGYVCVTEPLGPRLADAIAYRGAVSDSRFANYHYRIVDNDRLMWSGGGASFKRDERRTAETFKAAIARTYPQLGDVAIAYAWSGTMGFTVHRMPQIGEVSPGLWVASGFGGHGLNTSAIAGNLIARAVVENDDTWREFLAYDLVWAGGRAGRVFARAMSFVRNWREELESTQAQRRDRQRRETGHSADAEPPDWQEAREAAEQAVADSKSAEAYEVKSLIRLPFRRSKAKTGVDARPDAETAADAEPASSNELDWKKAKRALGPRGR
jgi:glycine/D-amino acid oxidase-like deaminating enzyme